MALKRILIALAVLLVLVVGCTAPEDDQGGADAGTEQNGSSASGTDEGSEEDADVSTGDQAAEDDADDSSGDESGDDSSAASLAWTKMPLVDVENGETFTISDFAGTQVYIQAFAVW